MNPPLIRRDITFLQYLNLVRLALRDYREWRLGQAFFDVLWGIRPDLSEQLRMGDYDPYYTDDALVDFLPWVRDHWDDLPPEN